MTLPSSSRAHKVGRLVFAATVSVSLAAADLVLSAQWSAPAFAKGGSNAGGNGGGGNAGGGNAGGGNSGGNSGNAGGSNAGGNGGAHGNPGGKGAPPAGPKAPSTVEDTDIALGLRNAGRIKPLAEVYAAAERQFDGRVIDARLVRDQRGGWIYDVRLVTEDGHLRDVAYRATNLVLVSIDGEPVE